MTKKNVSKKKKSYDDEMIAYGKQTFTMQDLTRAVAEYVSATEDFEFVGKCAILASMMMKNKKEKK